MKKIVTLIILLSIIVLNGKQNQKTFSLQEYFKTGELSVYVHNDKHESNNILPNIKIIKSPTHSAIGESIFWNSCEVGSVIKTLDATILFSEHLQEKDLTILCCYSPKIKKTVTLNNQQINLQIATCEDYTVIGWPMILGSF